MCFDARHQLVVNIIWYILSPCATGRWWKYLPGRSSCSFFFLVDSEPNTVSNQNGVNHKRENHGAFISKCDVSDKFIVSAPEVTRMSCNTLVLAVSFFVSTVGGNGKSFHACQTRLRNKLLDRTGTLLVAIILPPSSPLLFPLWLE